MINMIIDSDTMYCQHSIDTDDNDNNDDDDDDGETGERRDNPARLHRNGHKHGWRAIASGQLSKRDGRGFLGVSKGVSDVKGAEWCQGLSDFCE